MKKKIIIGVILSLALLLILFFREIFLLILINIILVGIPVSLTVANIVNLFLKKKFSPGIVDSLIFILGPIFTLLLYNEWYFPELANSRIS